MAPSPLSTINAQTSSTSKRSSLFSLRNMLPWNSHKKSNKASARRHHSPCRASDTRVYVVPKPEPETTSLPMPAFQRAQSLPSFSLPSDRNRHRYPGARKSQEEAYLAVMRQNNIPVSDEFDSSTKSITVVSSAA